MAQLECFYNSLLTIMDLVDILDKNSRPIDLEVQMRAKEEERVFTFKTTVPKEKKRAMTYLQIKTLHVLLFSTEQHTGEVERHVFYDAFVFKLELVKFHLIFNFFFYFSLY